MRHTVNKESYIQSDAESGVEVNPERVPDGFVPKINRNGYWQ